MSGVIIILPVVTAAAWPVMSTAAVAVLTAMGYTMAKSEIDQLTGTETGEEVKPRVELNLANSGEVGAAVGRDQSLAFEGSGVTVIFRRTVRGRLSVCVEGDLPKSELEALGRTLAGKVIQQYACNRILETMKQKTGVSVVEQSVDDDETIRLKLRGWEE